MILEKKKRIEEKRSENYTRKEKNRSTEGRKRRWRSTDERRKERKQNKKHNTNVTILNR